MNHSHSEFPIISLTRDDLETAGFDSKTVDDDLMARLASKMADACCDEFFDILEDLAKRYDIPTRNVPSLPLNPR